MWNPMRGYCVGDVFFADEMDVSRMDTVISLSISPLSQVIWNTQRAISAEILPRSNISARLSTRSALDRSSTERADLPDDDTKRGSSESNT